MSQTSTRVGWNGGLGGWAGRQCRGFMDFALCPCFPFGAIRGVPLLRLTALLALNLIADHTEAQQQHSPFFGFGDRIY